jgi:glycosyltransferase involved in cell wall biosynthesis
VNLPVSVIVPAHDEGPRISRCLESLLAGPDASALDIVVVANGCSDDTAARARAVAPDARVVEIDAASKSRALNVGDAMARHFPRVYLDADMQIDAAGIRRLVAALGGPVEAAGLRSRMVTDHSSALVRSYLRVWSRLPSVYDGLVGNGVIALDARGRSRFTRFPDAMGDDFFLDRLFEHDAKRVLDGGGEVLAPVGVADLLRRKVRVFAGNRQVAALPSSNAGPGGGTGWLSVVRHDPRRIGDAVVFVAISVMAKLATRRALRAGDIGWTRDDSRAAEGAGSR